REKLIITGTVDNFSGAVSKWTEISGGIGRRIDGSSILKCSRYIDWIGASLVKHNPGFFADFNNGGIYTCNDGAGDSCKWLIRVWNKEDMLEAVPRDGEMENDFENWLDSIEKGGDYTVYRNEID